MRTDSANFQAHNRATVSKRVVVIELSISSDNSEFAYLTSHQVDDLPTGAGITHFQSCIKKCSSTSQKLKVSDFKSTIGAIKASASDGNGLTGYLRTAFGEGKTTSQNRFRMYAGFFGLPFDDFSLVQTQIVRHLSYDRGEIEFQCLDVQRDTKKTIFDPKITLLTADMASDDMAATVQSTSGFELVWHGPSYSDAPSVDAGYIHISDGEDNYEIMRWSGKSSGSFTIVERGAFGTIPQEWLALDEDGESNELEVSEFIYLEVPVAKLAYAVLTGNLYGDSGKSLPDHWHLDISEQWVSTSEFTEIGLDIWDPADDTRGKICRFFGIDKHDGRKFINEQLMPLIGCFMRISATGEFGLRRISSVLSTSPYTALLTQANITKISAVKYAQDEIQNRMQVDWSWNFRKEDYQRASLFRDSHSAIDKNYGWREEKIVSLKGMHGDRHSRDFIKGLFSSLRDRYGSEPIYCKVSLIPGLNVLEVADTVRLSLENWEDYTDTGDINRTFEVQGVSVDWLKGGVTVDLFGSTHDGSPLADDGDGYSAGFALSDAMLTSEGDDIESVFSGNVSRSGNLVTVDSGFTFNAALDSAQPDGTPNPDCILYCDGDLIIPSGVTLSYTGTMILICTGVLTVNGEISGEGGGPAGGDYRRCAEDQAFDNPSGFGSRYTVYENFNGAYPDATRGFNHTTLIPQFGGCIVEGGSNLFVGYMGDTASVGNVLTSSSLNSYLTTSVPAYEIESADLAGLPALFYGGSGPAGGNIFSTTTGTYDVAAYEANGSDGGAGGGGLITITRGMSFGVSGLVNVSGGDADTNAGTYTVDGETFYGGRGCGGAPGNWLCLVDGGDSVAPLVDSTKFVARYGNGDTIGNILPDYNVLFGGNMGGIPGNNHACRNISTTEAIGDENQWQSHHRVQFLLPPNDAPGEETPADTVAPNVTSLSLTENTNTPQSPAGNLSTVDVLVTPPASTAYSFSRIYVRLQGSTAWNMLEFAAEDETTFTEQSNGATWEVQARSVSVSGVENASGPTETITLTNKAASTDYALEIGYDENDETLLRVIDLNDSNAVVGSVSGGGGIAGKVVAGAGSSGFTNVNSIVNGDALVDTLAPLGLTALERTTANSMFGAAAWRFPSGMTLNQYTDIFGSESGNDLSPPGFIEGELWSIGFWARNDSTLAIDVGFAGGSGFGVISIPASSAWAFYSANFTVPAGGEAGRLETRNHANTVLDGAIYFDGFMLLQGTIAIDGSTFIRSATPTSEIGADQTQTALDDEVTTTGGVILSTNGAVRTAGKTSINDGNAGVYLGRDGSDNVMYVGDGADKCLKFDGTDLIIGSASRLIGVESANRESGMSASIEHHQMDKQNTTANTSVTVNPAFTELSVLSSAGASEYVYVGYDKMPYPESGDWFLDPYLSTDYREFIFVLGNGVTTNKDGVIWSVSHGYHDATPGGFGVVYDPSYGAWRAWIRHNGSGSYALNYIDIPELNSLNPVIVRLVYTGSSSTGGEDSFVVYANGALKGTVAGLGAVAMGAGDFITAYGDVDSALSTTESIRVGHIRVFATNPGNVF